MEKNFEKFLSPSFYFKNGKFYIEEISAEEIAEECGTPVYVYSYNFLISQIKKIKKAFSSLPVKICFSIKSNSNLSILKIIKENGLGADVVSEGELKYALKAGFEPSDIVFAGVGKKEKEIELGIKEGIFCFNIENEDEIDIIEEISKKYQRKTRVNLRLNLDIDVDTHHYVKTSKTENKFGLDIETAGKMLKKKFKFVEIKGIHFHLGSQIKEVKPYLIAIEKVKDFCKKNKFSPEVLDIGGGFGIHYTFDEKIASIEEFGEKISSSLKDFDLKTLIVEPGRFIVGNAGILISKVLYVKKRKNKNFLIVDAGMNDLIRPTLYGSYHTILPSEEKRCKKIKFDVVGPICETGDFLGKDRELPSCLKRGDYIIILSAGAYGFSMSSNYNSRPRPAEVLVKGNRSEVIRERENIF